ncbi:hypothetical protein MCELHM10_00562 [Paracoccaceae bacterium]|jgi:hypothetical protein
MRLVGCNGRVDMAKIKQVIRRDAGVRLRAR